MHTGRKRKAPAYTKRRDFRGDLIKLYGTPDKLRAAMDRFSVRRNKPISPRHEVNLDACKRSYISFHVLAHSVSEEEAARVCFGPDADVPPFCEVKLFLWCAATEGRSGVRGGKGWSKRTTFDLFRNLTSARNRSFCKPFPQEYKDQISAEILHWVADGHISAEVKDKPIIRLPDFVDAQAAILSPHTRISKNRIRVQLLAFTSTLFFTGQRPGALVESAGYEGKNQCLTWGDLDFTYTGRDELGPKFHVAFTFRWIKGFRNTGQRIIVHLCTTGGKDVHICPINPYISLGIRDDVFVEDIRTKYYEGNVTRKQHVAIKEEAKNKPVFLNAKGDKAWTVAAARHAWAKVADALGWSRSNLYAFRISAATSMANANMPEHILRYFLGHSHNSPLTYTTYQSLHKPTDLVALALGKEADPEMADVAALCGSVSYAKFCSGELTLMDKSRIFSTLAPHMREALELAYAAENMEDNEVQDDIAALFLAAASAVSETSVVTHRLPEREAILILKHFKAPYQELLFQLANPTADDRENTLLEAARSNFDHPHIGLSRITIIDRFEDLLVHDAIKEEGGCPTCLILGTTMTDAEKANPGEHYLRCEAKLYTDFKVKRCGICLLLVKDNDKKSTPLSTDDFVRTRDAFNEHHARCDANFWESFCQEEGPVDDDGEVVQQDGNRADIKVGLGPFTLSSLTNDRAVLHRYVCPICIGDPGATWDESHLCFFTVQEVVQHIYTHFTPGPTAASETRINYDAKFNCHLPTCDNTVEYKSKTFIEHLHNYHHIHLIQCTKNHEHGVEPCVTTLPDDFRYYQHAFLEAQVGDVLDYTMPDSCLVDKRRPERRNFTAKKVYEKLEALDYTVDVATYGHTTAQVEVVKVYRPDGRLHWSSDAPSTLSPVDDPLEIPASVPVPDSASALSDSASASSASASASSASFYASASTSTSLSASTSTSASSSSAPRSRLSLPRDYTLDTFASDFNISSSVLKKLKAMEFFPLGYHKDFFDTDDLAEAGLSGAEYITVLRKHECLYDAKTRGRFTSSADYSPTATDILDISQPHSFAELQQTDAVYDKLTLMGYSLDDPAGMNLLSDDAWRAADVSPKERAAIFKAHARFAFPCLVLMY